MGGLDLGIDFTEIKEKEMDTESIRISEQGDHHVAVECPYRPDLPDFGGRGIADCLREVRCEDPDFTLEIWAAYMGELKNYLFLTACHPEMIQYNLNRIPRMFQMRRPGETLEYILSVLTFIKRQNPEIITKTELSLCCDETEEEILHVMRMAREAGCDIFSFRLKYKWVLTRGDDEVREMLTHLRQKGMTMGYYFIDFKM